MASTYLSRTQSSPNSQIFTISMWVKKCKTNTVYIMNMESDDDNRIGILFNGNELELYGKVSASAVLDVRTNAVYRDVNAWYHIVAKVDTTQATASDRAKIYVNGEEITSLKTSTYPSQNTNFSLTNHYIGNIDTSQSYYFDGSITHYHYIDGTAYDASTFGQSDANGVWTPKLSPSVTYGTNGFFLKFNEGALGTDSSPNGNNFTASGSLTASKDTPENIYATLNSIANGGANLTITNGNTTVYDSDSTWRSGFGGLAPSSGKWYFEVKNVGSSSNVWIGIMDSSQLDGTGAYKFVAKSRGYGYSAGGEKGNSGTETAGWGDTYAQNDIVGVAMDLDNNKIYFSKNGTWQDSGDPTSGATGTGSMYNLASGYSYFPSTSLYSTSAGVSFNFGNGYFGTTAVSSAGSNGNGSIFEYDVPTGYYALNTKNLATYG